MICLALSCSFSVGVFTSQAKKDLGSEKRREEKRREEKRRVGCYNSCSGGLQVEKVEEIDREEE